MTHGRPSRSRPSKPSMYGSSASITDSDKRMNAQEQSLKSIAQSHHLSDSQTKDYVKFMQERFPNERDENYMGEWATRFRNKSEWAHADNESRDALKKANADVYGTEEKRKDHEIRSQDSHGRPKIDTVPQVNYVYTDSWGRRVYNDRHDKTKKYVVVDGELHTMTKEGEPLAPVRKVVALTNTQRQKPTYAESKEGSGRKGYEFASVESHGSALQSAKDWRKSGYKSYVKKSKTKSADKTPLYDVYIEK